MTKLSRVLVIIKVIWRYTLWKNYINAASVIKLLQLIGDLEDDRQKPFQCCQCDEAFPTINEHKIHMRTHTGEKTYQCNQCDKALSTNTGHQLNLGTYIFF